MCRDSRNFSLVGLAFLGRVTCRDLFGIQEDHSRHAWTRETFVPGSIQKLRSSLMWLVIFRPLVVRGWIFIVHGFDLNLSLPPPVPRITQGESLSLSEVTTWISMIAGKRYTIDRGVRF